MGRDIAALVAALAAEDKARLTVGRDAGSTAPVESAGIPPVGMTDGPEPFCETMAAWTQCTTRW